MIAKGFWIPPAARLRADEKRYRCFTCGAEDADERHVIDCSREHEDVERAMLAKDGSVWNGQPVDEDLEEWVAKYRKPLLEGKMKL